MIPSMSTLIQWFFHQTLRFFDSSVKLRPGEFIVEKILGKRIRSGEVEYLIKWEGYGVNDCTWEPAKQCDSSNDIFDDGASDDTPVVGPSNVKEEGMYCYLINLMNARGNQLTLIV
ncbi:chromo' (CHRromatin Organization MOdifier) domain protein [Necator americanus]|uniref:Chromo' (CHRromatin Organization MOdifier) domain protein n=1 Tax=Necator americanus TaxID=51031 RepID=W2T826_NECAM|nr:chromo' (CHRromatin Organization MOdifier) domain protein [Necator americanus]ETN78175.1 chromo' (CHRromatin Organization MOdifier) domain protein [Necator americanus]